MDTQPVTNVGVVGHLKAAHGADQQGGIDWMVHFMERNFTAFEALIAPEGRFCFGDEPTLGVDARSLDTFLHLLVRIREERELTIVMVSHDFSVMTTHADEIVCLAGEVRCMGSPTDLDEAKLTEVFGEHTPQVGDLAGALADAQLGAHLPRNPRRVIATVLKTFEPVHEHADRNLLVAREANDATHVRLLRPAPLAASVTQTAQP